MRKLAITAASLIVFVALLIWVATQERGRVADKEEVFRKEIAKADDLVKLEVVKYDRSAVTEDTGAADEATPDAEGSAEGDTSAKKAEKPKEKSKPKELVVASRFVVEKRGDEWFVIEPFEGAMDPETAASMVKSFVELKPSVREGADVSAKEFGLSNPALKIVGSLASGKQVEVTLGEDTPVGAKVFAKISDKEGLFLVPSSLKTDMDKEPDKIRDRKVARFEKEAVQKVTFVNEFGTITAEKSQKGEEVNWKITSPGPYPGDEWAITSAFGKAGELEAKEFPETAKDLKKFGLDKPRAECTIELKDGKTVKVLVGKQIRKKVKTNEYSDTDEEKDLVYAQRAGRPDVLLVESSLFESLNQDVMALRDKHIIDFERDHVIAVKVARKKGLSFTVQRAGDAWTLQMPQTGPAKRTKIDDIIWDLSDLEATEYVKGDADLKQMGLAVPQTVVTITLTGGKTLKVKFGDRFEKDGKVGYYCQTSESKQVYEVNELVMTDLPETIEDVTETAGSFESSMPDLGLEGMPEGAAAGGPGN